MPKEFTVVRYRFEELSEEAQEKAIADAQSTLAMDCPTEYIEEIMLDMLGQILNGAGDDWKDAPESITIPEWDASWSQGRTVQLAGSLNREQAPLLHNVWPENISYLGFGSSGYYGQRITFHDSEGDYVDPPKALVEELKDIRSKMLDAGTRAYEDYYSVDAARARILECEDEDAYIFLSNGKVDIPVGEKETANV